MNKKELTAKMSRDAGITSRQAEKAFNSVIDGIKDSLKKGKRVIISGFGSFEVKARKARKVKNPRTGEVMNIPKKKRVKLNPSKTLTSSL